MTAILTETDALTEAFQPLTRSSRSQAAFEKQRADRIADGDATPLERVRLNWRNGHGLTREELSERTGGRVSVSTIQRAERGQLISDQNFAMLALALIDPTSDNYAMRRHVPLYRAINPQALVF